ncbi:MAG: hypothetical protein ACRDHL_02265, partial [Candidatus Promineifilaceae bacterium]
MTSWQRRGLILAGALLGAWGLAAASGLVARGWAAANDVTITVDSASAAIGADGFCTLPEAMQAAETNTTLFECVHDGSAGLDTIQFDAGLTGATIALTAGFTVTEQLALIGLGADALTVDMGLNDRFLHIAHGAAVSVEDLRLIQGQVSAQGEKGGAIQAFGALSLSDSLLAGNVADSTGGAIHVGNNGTLIVAGTTFVGNSAKTGGAIDSDGEVSVSGSLFSANQVTGAGGAIHNSGPLEISATSFEANVANVGGALESRTGGILSQTTFSGNLAYESGGAIFMAVHSHTVPLQAEEMSISASTFFSNSAEFGGALFVGELAILNIDFTVLSANLATQGGAIHCEDAPIMIAHSTLTANQATQDGGALFLDGCSLDMLMSTLNANTAANGAGLALAGGSAEVSNSTFSANQAAAAGGGV